MFKAGCYKRALVAGARVNALASTETVPPGPEKIINAPDKHDITPRMAASSYLNTAPLIWSFTRGTRRGAVKIVDAVPARCADLLGQSEVDVALVPIIEYQRLPNVTVSPGVCVGSRERVRSVVLVTKAEKLHDLRRIALDKSSRTSAALLRIIFREFVGFEPEWISRTTDVEKALADNEGALIIGDPAMTFARAGLQLFDLAALWRGYTGLGFVFAMWLLRDEAPRAARLIDFAGARDEGLARVAEITDYYENSLGLSRAELEIYLRENISFSVDDGMRAGMELYFTLARKHGIIAAVKSLKFVEPEQEAY